MRKDPVVCVTDLPDTDPGPASGPFTVSIVSRDELDVCPAWLLAFPDQRKDHRYYEIVEDTIRDNFAYKYFAIRDGGCRIRAVQPFFMVDQDVLEGLGHVAGVETMRKLWPRFLRLRTLMVGCTAGEGHLTYDDSIPAALAAQILSRSITAHAQALGAHMIVLKEFPARYRPLLDCFTRAGYARIPSMPMTRLNIEYDSFESYLTRALKSSTRRKLRKNLEASANTKIEMSVVEDITPYVSEVYPLYLQVYHRSTMQFEKLTGEYFLQLSRRMRDKMKFFVWRQAGRAVAFSMCMIQGDSLYAEYVGLDYAVATDLHLYHYIVRDMISWAMSRRFKWFRSTALNYDPKLHMRHELDPIDLYVRFTSPLANLALKHLVPLLGPVRSDKVLPKFANYRDLW